MLAPLQSDPLLSDCLPQVSHVEGSVDPVRDLHIIHRELQFKDIAAVRAYITKHARNVARNVGGKEAKADLTVAVKALNWLLHGEFTGSADDMVAAMSDVSKKSAAEMAAGASASASAADEAAAGAGEEEEEEEEVELGKDIRAAPWSADEIDIVNKFHLLTAKPMVYLMNLSMKQFLAQKCKWIVPVKEYIKQRGNGEKFIPFSAAFEAQFAEMGDTEERAKWLAENGGLKSVIPKIVKSGYKALRLVHFFTCGADEVKAWTVRSGSTAPKAAGVIHSDIEKGFICAEVKKYDDLHEREAAARPRLLPSPCRPGVGRQAPTHRAFPSLRSSQWAPSRPSRRRASSAPKARPTSSTTATSCSSR